MATAVAEQLRRALDEGGFVFFAQPIVELASDRVTQHELLIRMRDPRGGLLAPAEFIPAAERHGLIAEIDRLAMRNGAELAARGHSVHVNVSGSTVADQRFGADVERELSSRGAAASNLVFELTETGLIGNEPAAVRFFDRVRALGCEVAIDDFGSGYGGFHYVKDFRVDYLKIDQEFVSDLAADPASFKVVDAVVRLAHAFELRTVAEGVEDDAALERLRSLRITHAQGYLCGRPEPARKLLAEAAASSADEGPVAGDDLGVEAAR